MQAIYITNEKSAFVDDDDFEQLNKFYWSLTSITTKSGRIIDYAIRSIAVDEIAILQPMHRDVMNTPEGLVTHHINFCGLDNRKQNLRIMTNSEHLRLHSLLYWKNKRQSKQLV